MYVEKTRRQQWPIWQGLLSLCFLCIIFPAVWLMGGCTAPSPNAEQIPSEAYSDTHRPPEEPTVPCPPATTTDMEENSETNMNTPSESMTYHTSDEASVTLPESDTISLQTRPMQSTDQEMETQLVTAPVRTPLERSVRVEPYLPSCPADIQNVKAIWLSQFDLTLIYKADDGKTQREEEAFRRRIRQVLQNVRTNGFHTVIVQVRPNADSMYPSDYYPPSAYVTGSYAQTFSYDPFDILVEEAKLLELSVHAWINPLRSVTSADLAMMDTTYAIRQWYDDDTLRGRYLVEYEGRWYLNPAYAEVRDLILCGAREILERYDVDGLHMDDYFYPTTDASFDSDAYAAYQAESGQLRLADWRRRNLDALVSDLYRAVKTYREELWFGISPAGILNTVYNKQYANVFRWCREPGFVDYILPQAYFGFEHATAAFDKVCHTWQDLVQTNYVSLLIGVSFGKALAQTDVWAGSGADEWKHHTDILARSLAYTLGLEKCRGISVFCYQYYYHPLTGTEVDGTRTERQAFTALLQEASWNPATSVTQAEDTITRK